MKANNEKQSTTKLPWFSRLQEMKWTDSTMLPSPHGVGHRRDGQAIHMQMDGQQCVLWHHYRYH